MDWNLSVAARTLYQEAVGEPPAGKRAVAHCIINRRKSGRWGDTYGAVCLARSQFSAWGPVVPSNSTMQANFRHSCALADDDPTLVALAAFITAAETESDPTGGSTHYYNPKAVPEPTWVKGHPPDVPAAIFCGKFGSQLFYRGVP